MNPLFEEFKLTKNRLVDGVVLLELSAKTAPRTCHECGSHCVIKNGYGTKTIKGLPTYEWPSILRIKYHKMICKNCGPFNQLFDSVDDKFKMTTALKECIEKESCWRSNAEIARAYHIAESTVKRVTDVFLESEVGTISRIPNEMGVREVRVLGRPRLLVVDVGSGEIVEVISDPTAKSFSDFLDKGNGDLRVAYLDCDSQYYDTISSKRPSSEIQTVLSPEVKKVLEQAKATVLAVSHAPNLSDEKVRARAILTSRRHIDPNTLEHPESIPFYFCDLSLLDAFLKHWNYPETDEPIEYPDI